MSNRYDAEWTDIENMVRRALGDLEQAAVEGRYSTVARETVDILKQRLAEPDQPRKDELKKFIDEIENHICCA